MSDFGKFISGVFIGGMVGGLLGVLLAPRAGEETRRKIADRTNETYKKAETSVQDTYKKAETSVQEMQRKTEQAIDDLQKSGQEVLRKIAGSVDGEKEASSEETIVDVEVEKTEDSTDSNGNGKNS